MVRWRRVAPAAPFCGIAALYVLYRQVYDTAGIDSVDLSIPAAAWRSVLGPQEAVADLGARLTWGIAVLAFGLAFLAVLAICLRVIWTASAGRARAALFVGALAGTAGGIVLGLAGNPLTLPQLVDALVEGFRLMGLDAGRSLLFFLNGLAMAVVMLLSFAASATLVRPSGRDAGTATLKHHALRLRHVLYSGAAVLIAGTAQAAAMHRLPVAYLEEPWSAALESAAQLTAGATGALWSLFLAAIYLPAALILRARLSEEAERALPAGGEKERREWLAEHGLDLSPVQQLKRLLAVLGPVLSSLPLTGLFDLLAG